MLREFGCGVVTSRHVRRCCRNRGGLLRTQKLDENAMHCKQQTTGPKGQGDAELFHGTAQWPSCVVVVIVEKPTKDRERREEERLDGSVGFLPLAGCGWFYPLSAPSN